MRRKDLTNKIQVLRKADLLLVSAKRIQRKLVQPFTGDAIQCSLWYTFHWRICLGQPNRLLMYNLIRFSIWRVVKKSNEFSIFLCGALFFAGDYIYLSSAQKSYFVCLSVSLLSRNKSICFVWIHCKMTVKRFSTAEKKGEWPMSGIKSFFSSVESQKKYPSSTQTVR